MKSICIIILFLLLNSFSSFAQVSSLLETHEKQFVAKEYKKSSFRSNTDFTNEVHQIVSASFLLYKRFISSQDQNTCVFHPSCSVYAIQSINKNGFVKGSLSAFDRLTRCHGLITDEYKLDEETQKYCDPVQ
jgi:putative membrane protein insertion efficiency factor